MKQRGRKSAASLAVVPAEPLPVPRTPINSPPAHISKDAAAWWRQVTADFELEGHHLRLLECACDAWDRMAAAKAELKAHGGLTFTDQNGNFRAHPAVAIERDARIAFARLVRELDLDAGSSSPSDRGRPPALKSNRSR